MNDISFDELYGDDSFGGGGRRKSRRPRSRSRPRPTKVNVDMGSKAPGGMYSGGMGTVGDILSHVPGTSVTDAMKMASNPNATPRFSDPGADAYTGLAGGESDGR